MRVKERKRGRESWILPIARATFAIKDLSLSSGDIIEADVIPSRRSDCCQNNVSFMPHRCTRPCPHFPHNIWTSKTRFQDEEGFLISTQRVETSGQCISQLRIILSRSRVHVRGARGHSSREEGRCCDVTRLLFALFKCGRVASRRIGAMGWDATRQRVWIPRGVEFLWAYIPWISPCFALYIHTRARTTLPLSFLTRGSLIRSIIDWIQAHW